MSRPARVALWALALLPAVIAVLQLGRIHPDEVYQALEPAFHEVRGYGVLAWEWQPQAGLRNWAFPLLLASLLRVADLLGLSHPQAYRALLALPQVLLQGAALLAVYRYAQRRLPEADPRWAAFATLLVGGQGMVLVFAGRTLGESLSAPLLLLAAEALDREEDAPSRTGLAAGLALGLAVVVRYASGVMVLAALVFLLARRRFAALGFTVLAGTGVALGLGWLDYATWGTPFHSLWAYLRFNVLTDAAAKQFGQAGPAFYLLPLLQWTPLWVWPGVGLCLWRERPRLPAPLFLGAVYLGALLATPHKEARFLYPGLVLLSLAAAPALLSTLRALARSRPGLRERALLPGAAALLLLAAAPLGFAPELRGDQFRAIVRATRGEDATGLLIVNEGLWGAGGYFYVGKPIPWLTCDWPHDVNFQRAMRDGRFNRAVSFEGRALEALQAHGFRVTGVIGRETLLAR